MFTIRLEGKEFRKYGRGISVRSGFRGQGPRDNLALKDRGSDVKTF